jgi:hypothetical protein
MGSKEQIQHYSLKEKIDSSAMDEDRVQPNSELSAETVDCYQNLDLPKSVASGFISSKYYCLISMNSKLGTLKQSFFNLSNKC